MKLTQLFPFSEKPAYAGVYAISYPRRVLVEYAYWDGAQWYCVSPTPDNAVDLFHDGVRSMSIYGDPPEYIGWSGIEVTPWFPISERPVRNGVYQIKLGDGHVVYSKWTDGVWYWMASNPAEAARDNIKSPSLRDSGTNLSWRGCLL